MGYSQEQERELVNQEEKRLIRDIGICNQVKAMVETDGWKATIGPTIDRMIVDVLGGKLGDTWVSGKVDRARSDERREFHIGYKQALIDLHARVMFHLQQLPVLEERLKQLQQEKVERFRVPMVDDTRYRPEG